ncbi:MAG: BrnA antitoxin family protein [Terriglobales bacterium]
MKGGSTRAGSKTRAKGKTDFGRLRAMRDEDIDYTDIPRLDESFWKNAKLTMPEPKDRLTIRIDHDVVEWLKKRGSGYQTRINAILRSYMKAQSGEGAHSRT